MLADDILAAAATWRPQLFGKRHARDIPDPIIEPLWTGPRILALVDRGQVRLTDDRGEPISGRDELVASLVTATAGSTVLLEATLSAQPTQTPGAFAARDSVQVPTPSQTISQMVVGRRSGRKDRLLDRAEEARREALAATSADVALVAVDLLWLDDESLCDVPLLERKRLLESVVAESDLIRVGIHIRPPIDAWLGSWRALGFSRLAFKAANSRYLPGQKNPLWALADIPQR
jgi:hypothetical protein